MQMGSIKSTFCQLQAIHSFIFLFKFTLHTHTCWLYVARHLSPVYTVAAAAAAGSARAPLAHNIYSASIVFVRPPGPDCTATTRALAPPPSPPYNTIYKYSSD